MSRNIGILGPCEQRRTVPAVVCSIPQECQIPGYEEPKADILSLVEAWLERKDGSPWRMVIDNADDTEVFFNRSQDPYEQNLGNYIPECSYGSILVTTRNKETSSQPIRVKQPIEVKKMHADESVQLLRAKFEDDIFHPSDLSNPSSRLEFLLLALVQAAAFIQEKSILVNEHLELLDKRDQDCGELLSEEFETVERDSETPHAIAVTWIFSFEQIQRQKLFKQAAFSRS